MVTATSLTVLEVGAVFLSITALLSYVNHRFIGLPTTIGVMVISIILSMVAIFLGLLSAYVSAGIFFGCHSLPSPPKSFDIVDKFFNKLLFLISVR